MPPLVTRVTQPPIMSLMTVIHCVAMSTACWQLQALGKLDQILHSASRQCSWPKLSCNAIEAWHASA